eukprot:g7190.t1
MDDERLVTPRAPRRRARASLSTATPPNLTMSRTPFATVGDSGGLRGAGVRQGRRGRASLSMATSPLVLPGAVTAGGAGESGQQDAVNEGSPWMGGRAESPSTAISPLPSTRGEMTHFRRAEELWKKASKAREGSRRRTMGAAPTLEQRMAWRREQEEEESAAGKGAGTTRPEPEEQRKQVERAPPPHRPPHQQHGQRRSEQPAAGDAGVAAGGGWGGDINGGGKGGIGVPPPLPPGTQRAATAAAAAAAATAAATATAVAASATAAATAAASGGGSGGSQAQQGTVQGEKGGRGEEGLDRATVRAKVLAIYQEHNKDKLHTVDEVLDKYAGRWGVMLQRLEEKYISASGLPPASGSGPTCFMDIEVGGEAVGRLVFRLFADKTPKAAENFRALCTGEKGRGLRYEGSAFHRIIPGFVVQGGDFTTGDGRGGRSIYGDKFEDEPFMRHHKLGLLSMANKGANTNNSQFFITLKAVAHLDGKHVVFGELQSGIKVLDRMKSVTLLEPKRDGKPAPEQRVVIARCGQLNEDGTEVPPPAAATSFGTPHSVGVFAPPSPATPMTSTPLFGQPSNLGGQCVDGFAALVKSQAACGWKCGACLVTNPESSLKCLSCETPKPGEEGKSGSGSGGGILGGSSSGSCGGFTFGAPAAATVAAGAPPAAAPSALSTNAAGGFTFGTAPAAATSATAGALAAGVAPSAPSGGTNASGGFTFGAPVSQATPAATPGNDATSGAGEAESDAPASSLGGGDSDSDSSSGDEEERREERAKAETAFDKVDSVANGWVQESQFEALMEAVGTTYSVEDHKPKLLSICGSDGKLQKEAFLSWYDEWLFGGDDSSDDDEEEGQTSSGKDAAGQCVDGFAALVKSQAACGWKCGACLVTNPESSLKCLSCETPKPGEEGKSGSGSGGGILGGSSSGPSGGFTFGAPAAATVAAGAPPAAAPSALSTNAAGGFTFGTAPAAATSATAGALAAGVAPSAPSGGTNASGGFTFGAPVAESLPATSATKPATSAVVPVDEASAESAAGNDCSSDDDSGDEQERHEERAKAETAFDEVDSGGNGMIEESQFEALMEAVGTTYSVEDHRPKLLSICGSDGKLQKEAFLSWYDEWLFGGDDSSDDDEEEGKVGSNDSAAGQCVDGFAALVKSQAACGWKCGVCLVTNPESSLKCLSCETPKPGEEGKTGSGSGGGILGGSSSGSCGGFTFGAPAASTMPAGEPSATASSALPTKAAVQFVFATASSRATAMAVPKTPAAASESTNGFAFKVAASSPSSGKSGTIRSGTSSPVVGLDAAADSKQNGNREEDESESPETSLGGAGGGNGNGNGARHESGVAESPFTFGSPKRAGGHGAAAGGGGGFGSFNSPPPVVVATGGGGNFFDAGSSGDAGGPTSPRALDNLTPRRRRASLAAAKLRRGSTGPAVGQRKKSPVRGARASSLAAAPVVVQDEEDEAPSLFGGEPKIY